MQPNSLVYCWGFYWAAFYSPTRYYISITTYYFISNTRYPAIVGTPRKLDFSTIKTKKMFLNPKSSFSFYSEAFYKVVCYCGFKNFWKTPLGVVFFELFRFLMLRLFRKDTPAPYTPSLFSYQLIYNTKAK